MSEDSGIGPGAVLLDRYRLETRLGRGGFGSVWRARDLSGGFDGPLAVKVLSTAGCESPQVRRRFSSEARLLLEIDHPNVVRAFDFVEDEHHLFLVLEFLPGRSLTEVLVRRGRAGRHFSEVEARAIFHQLCAGVAAAHSAGAVHRDLKPGNIMLVSEGGQLRVKVLDFGIAKILSQRPGDQTTLGRMVGSYLYMSPEQALGAPVDARADIFALGTLLFEILTLHRAWALGPLGGPLPIHEPFRLDAENSLVRVLERIVKGPRPRPSDLRKSLPSALDRALLRALAPRPSARIDTVPALFDAIETAFEERSKPVNREPLDRPADLGPLLGAPEDPGSWSHLGSWEAPPELEHPPSPEIRRELEATVSRFINELGVEPDETPLVLPVTPDRLAKEIPVVTFGAPARLGRRLRAALLACALLGCGAALGAGIYAGLSPAANDPRFEPAASHLEPTASPRLPATPVEPQPRPTAARASAPPTLEAPGRRARPNRAEPNPRPHRPDRPDRPNPASLQKPATASLPTRVAALRQNPEPRAFAEVAEAIVDASRGLPERSQRRIRRLVFAAQSSGDVQGLEKAVELLMVAQALP